MSDLIPHLIGSDPPKSLAEAADRMGAVIWYALKEIHKLMLERNAAIAERDKAIAELARLKSEMPDPLP